MDTIIIQDLAVQYRVGVTEAERASLIPLEYMTPEVVCTPQEAFYADTTVLPIEQSEGHICAELVMCYPPGIPMLSPGERITH